MTLIQYAWSAYRKRRLRHRYTEWRPRTDTRGDSRLLTEETRLGRNLRASLLTMDIYPLYYEKVNAWRLSRPAVVPGYGSQSGLAPRGPLTPQGAPSKAS